MKFTMPNHARSTSTAAIITALMALAASAGAQTLAELPSDAPQFQQAAAGLALMSMRFPDEVELMCEQVNGCGALPAETAPTLCAMEAATRPKDGDMLRALIESMDEPTVMRFDGLARAEERVTAEHEVLQEEFPEFPQMHAACREVAVHPYSEVDLTRFSEIEWCASLERQAAEALVECRGGEPGLPRSCGAFGRIVRDQLANCGGEVRIVGWEPAR